MYIELLANLQKELPSEALTGLLRCMLIHLLFSLPLSQLSSGMCKAIVAT